MPFFNTDRLKTSLLILLGLSLIAFFHNPYLIWGVLGLLYLLSIKELIKFGFNKNKTFIYYSAIVIWSLIPFEEYTHIIMILSLIGIAEYSFNEKTTLHDVGVLFYPSLGLVSIFLIYKEGGLLMLCALITIVSLTDIGAYIVGKTIGKTQFSLSSPNKTWEGVIGGVLFSSIISYFVLTPFSNLSFYILIIIIVLISSSSIVGDLFESKLKRIAGVKDSGNLLPGHGGILDRIDGYLIASPLFYILLI